MYKGKNCWEFMNCGREPDGINVQELGVCPATQDTSSDGINGGKNAGRICWAVTGTFCGGKKQGTFVKKLSTCLSCNFYKLVKKELSYNFMFMKPKKK
ncbi:two-CW domain-containing protein [Candidatus Latescibacterota bacterium]